MKKIFALFLAAMMALCAVSAFAEAPAAVEATDDGEFPEYPIGPDDPDYDNETVVDFMNISAVYFQPVDMAPAGKALAKEESTCHIEADIKANSDKYGFGVGNWVGYLTINYEVTDAEGKVLAEGSFMPMSAADGSHYGANINIPEGTGYTLKLSILSPAENGYLLHIDAETGVEGNFDTDWTEPLVVEFPNWDFIVHGW